MKAAYHTPDALPRVYPCREGAVEGTIDLLNADGRAIVTGLPVVAPEAAAPAKAYGVLIEPVAAKSPAKLKAKTKPKDFVETAPEPDIDRDDLAL